MLIWIFKAFSVIWFVWPIMMIELHVRKWNSIKYRHHYTSSSFRWASSCQSVIRLDTGKKFCSVKFFEQIYLYLVSTSVLVVNSPNSAHQTISFSYMFLYILYWIYYNIKYIKLLGTGQRIQSPFNLGSSWQINMRDVWAVFLENI